MLSAIHGIEVLWAMTQPNETGLTATNADSDTSDPVVNSASEEDRSSEPMEQDDAIDFAAFVALVLIFRHINKLLSSCTTCCNVTESVKILTTRRDCGEAVYAGMEKAKKGRMFGL